MSATSLFSRVVAAVWRRSPAPARPLRVLIVDDEEPIVKFVERVVRQSGFVTATAASGADALAVAATFGPVDLLLTDLMMPNMNGDELARRMRAQEPDLKVLYLTGFSDKLFAERMTLWENEAFLDKPCSMAGLQEAVKLLTSGRLKHLDPGARPETTATTF